MTACGTQALLSRPVPAPPPWCSEAPLCSQGEHRPPVSWLIWQLLGSPPRHRGPGRGSRPAGSLTSNWISTVPLSRPFFSCSMDPSKVSPPSGHMGKMASGKSWFSSSSDLISANEWTAVADKKVYVWHVWQSSGDPFIHPNYTSDTRMQMGTTPS